MRNEMYDKNTEKRQHLDARNETNAINLFGLAFLCGNADEKWNQLSRRGIRQLTEASTAGAWRRPADPAL